MKFASFASPTGYGVGLLTSDLTAVSPIPALTSAQPEGMLRLIEDWEALAPMIAGETGDPTPLSELELLAPIPRPRRNIFCVGKNYAAHAREFGQSEYDATGDAQRPAKPVFFTKASTTVIAAGADIPCHADLTTEMDYEAELAVVIGRGGRGISREHALDHVWGYTIVNDVTARDLQRDHQQWFLGKSLDGFCPMGPFIATADDVDASDLKISCSVNGELRQAATTKDLIFDVASLIATLSAGITLLPGDIIATGTPEGVGVGFTPPKFLTGGDEVRVEIAGLGVLHNRVG